MALYALRARRVASLTYSLFNQPFSSICAVSAPLTLFSATVNTQKSKLDIFQTKSNLRNQARAFRSSAMLLSSRSRMPNGNVDTDHIDPDAILFEGCDYNHWLITMDFPKDPKPSAEEMVETYVQTAAKVLGSVEEAKKKIYACSTTTYQGFQVEVSEELSEKFRGLPGVVFILPDSYIDPINKEYGGDKYINGTIIPRPPPVQYGRQRGRYGDRNREFNRGPRGPMQQNSPPQQNYGPPVTGERRDPMPMNNAPGGQGNFQEYKRDQIPSDQGNYNQGPMQWNPPPQQNYGPPVVGERRDSMPMNNAPGGQGNYQEYRRNQIPSDQENFNQGERRNYYPPQDQRNFAPTEQRDFRGNDRNYAPPQGRGFGQGADGNYGQRAGKNYGQNAGLNYEPGAGGNYMQGVGGNYGQRSGGNYVQGSSGSYGQGAFGNSGQGIGDRGLEMWSGYGQNSTGYGENPSFPQVEQRNNVQEQQGNYAVMEEAGNTQGRF